MPSNDEQVKHEVKQYKPCQVMMNLWNMTWNNTNFPHWFINTGHDFYCFTSLTGSSSLGMVCIVWLRASLVDPYCAWFVLSHFMLHWFFIRGHGLCCFTSCFIGSSLLGMVCIVWNNTNHGQQWRTSEEWGETTHILPSRHDKIKHDFKQHKPCPLMKKQWIIKWKKLSHAQ
jgi:hypothetical protein